MRERQLRRRLRGLRDCGGAPIVAVYPLLAVAGGLGEVLAEDTKTGWKIGSGNLIEGALLTVW